VQLSSPGAVPHSCLTDNARAWRACVSDSVDPAAAASARRFMHHQDGMRAIGGAVADLAEDPLPAGGFHKGRYHRLRVGCYRILYVIDGDVITVERVDRLPDR
jgi:hypothetical protein